MKQLTLKIALKVRSPYLFPTLNPGDFHNDLYALRNADERPIIPQDQMRGVFREALGKLNGKAGISAADIDKMFGVGAGDVYSPSEDKDESKAFSRDTDTRGRIYFKDAVCRDKEGNDESHSVQRTAICQESGTSKDGGLFAFEMAVPRGEDSYFIGRVMLCVEDKDEAEKWVNAFKAASTWISAIGSMKSSGFGRVMGVEVEQEKCVDLLPATPASDRLGKVVYILTFDRPFLVNAVRAAGNLYIGQETIPGAVLKGALARKLELAGLNQRGDDVFSKIAFSHAVRRGAKPLIPLSFYARPEEENEDVIIRDASIEEDLEKDLDAKTLLKFVPDWKSKEYEKAYEGLPQPKESKDIERDTRIHVELGEDGTAKSGKIYESISIVPKGQEWHLEVDFSKAENNGRALEIKSYLEAGLFGVGKTGAGVEVRPVEPEKDADNALEFTNAIMLKTDAVIQGNAETACKFYKRYWRNRGLTLKTFYARQDIAGGYIGHKFACEKRYRPFLLTKAGSVFVFSDRDVKKLEELAKEGVPPKINGNCLNWKECPFQTENGYGAVVPVPKLDKGG